MKILYGYQRHSAPVSLDPVFLCPCPFVARPQHRFAAPRVIPVVVDQSVALQEAFHGETRLLVSCFAIQITVFA